MQKNPEKKQQYSMSFIAAITQDKLACSQIIEGAYDATLFEDVLFQMLSKFRSDEHTKDKAIVLFMDNATFHHHSRVLELCQTMKVNVLFNAEYSPWLNPIELLFGYVKRSLQSKITNTK
jgi:transposase